MNKKYALKTGKDAAKRLDIQNDFFLESHSYYLKKAGLKEGMIVCDIGCGNGAMTEYLAKMVGKSGKVYAIDISQDQIGVASKRIKDANLDNVEFIRGDITSDDFEIKADIIFIRLVLMHLQNPSLAIKNMKKLLKNDSVIVSFESNMQDALDSAIAPIIKEYMQSVIKIGEAKKVNYSLGGVLQDIYDKEGFETESYKIEVSQPADHMKYYHPMLLDELKKPLLEYKILDEEKISAIKDAFKNLPSEQIGLDKFSGTMVIAKNYS